MSSAAHGRSNEGLTASADRPEAHQLDVHPRTLAGAAPAPRAIMESGTIRLLLCTRSGLRPWLRRPVYGVQRFHKLLP